MEKKGRAPRTFSRQNEIESYASYYRVNIFILVTSVKYTRRWVIQKITPQIQFISH